MKIQLFQTAVSGVAEAVDQLEGRDNSPDMDHRVLATFRFTWPASVHSEEPAPLIAATPTGVKTRNMAARVETASTG